MNEPDYPKFDIGTIMKCNQPTDLIFNVVCHYCKDILKYSNNCWYIFGNNKWVGSPICDNYNLKSMIHKFNDILSTLTNNSNISDDDKKIILHKLSHTFRDATIERAISNLKYKFDDCALASNFDSVLGLIGFRNGVYDSKIKKFRKGVPNDMIRTSCDYNFCENYSKNKNNMMEFIDEVLPNKDKRDEFLNCLAVNLIGNGLTESGSFMFFVGPGSNGKSKMAHLILATFNNYVENMPLNYNSIVLRLKTSSAKLVIIPEDENNCEKISKESINALTGFHIDSCYKLQNRVVLQTTNHVPPIVTTLNNANNKYNFKFVEFLTKFVHNPTHKHHKMIREITSKEIKSWRNDFMLLLIDYYKNPDRNELNLYKTADSVTLAL